MVVRIKRIILRTRSISCRSENVCTSSMNGIRQPHEENDNSRNLGPKTCHSYRQATSHQLTSTFNRITDSQTSLRISHRHRVKATLLTTAFVAHCQATRSELTMSFAQIAFIIFRKPENHEIPIQLNGSSGIRNVFCCP